VKRVLRWITTDGCWALRLDDFTFESRSRSMFLFAHNRAARTPSADARGENRYLVLWALEPGHQNRISASDPWLARTYVDTAAEAQCECENRTVDHDEANRLRPSHHDWSTISGIMLRPASVSSGQSAPVRRAYADPAVADLLVVDARIVGVGRQAKDLRRQPPDRAEHAV